MRQRVAVPAAIADQSAELALVSCCCISRGSLSAHVRMDRDRCQPGEQVGGVPCPVVEHAWRGVCARGVR